MKKKTCDIYYKYLTLENLRNTYYSIRKTCKNKNKILKYEVNLNSNLLHLYNNLYNMNYKHKKFNIFMIHEPKARIVMSEEIDDKIVNHFVSKYYLNNYLECKLIDSNVATRKGKGTSYADKLVIKYLNQLNMKYDKIYSLKLDISKYFYNINKDKLISILEEDILDKRVINLIKELINETDKDYVKDKVKLLNIKYNECLPCYGGGFGLSIGAQSSQFLAIYYLNRLDYYIKYVLKCKYYIRYMDDLVIFHYNKEYLINCFNNIRRYVNRFDLCLNKKSNIHSMVNGIDFLGSKYRICNGKLIVSPYRKTVVKINKRLKCYGKYNKFKYYRALASYKGYFNKFNIDVGDYRMDINSKYNEIKSKYNNYVVIIRDKEFYRSFGDCAKIIYFLTDYKFDGEYVCFGIRAYNKVINLFNKYSLCYVIYDEKENVVVKNNNRYNELYSLACDYYNRMLIRKEIFNKIDNIIDDDSKMNSLNIYLDEL